MQLRGCEFISEEEKKTDMQLRGCEFISEEEKKTLRVGDKVHPWERTVWRM